MYNLYIAITFYNENGSEEVYYNILCKDREDVSFDTAKEYFYKDMTDTQKKLVKSISKRMSEKRSFKNSSFIIISVVHFEPEYVLVKNDTVTKFLDFSKKIF